MPRNDRVNLRGISNRTRFNRRRRRLHVYISEIQTHISHILSSSSKSIIIDSIPVPIIKLVREKTFRSFKQDISQAPAKGYSSVNRSWFIGYKLHAIIWEDGVVQQSGITPGNVHDINFLKQAEFDNFETKLIGDRAYISKVVQLNLFENYQVKLKVPFRANQHDYRKHPKKYKNKRQMVETFFAQLCDQMNLKRNYAKSFAGLVARISSKVSCMSILNLINFNSGRKLSQVKHALSF